MSIYMSEKVKAVPGGPTEIHASSHSDYQTVVLTTWSIACTASTHLTPQAAREVAAALIAAADSLDVVEVAA